MRKILSLLTLSTFLLSTAWADVSFDKTDDILSCGTSDTLLKENVAFTVSFWVYVVSGGGEASSVGYVIARDQGSTSGVVIGTELGNASKSMIRLFIRGGTLMDVESSLDAFDINTWTHVVVTHDGSSTAANAHIYINGTETTYITQSNGATPGDNSAQTLTIGNNVATTRTFDGRIEELAVYSSVLGAQDRLNLYSRVKRTPLQVSPSTLVGYWALDECSDAASCATASMFRDLSTGANHCSPSNNPTGKAGEVLSYA